MAVRPGDVIEIPVSDGVAYAQVVRKEPSLGPLVRVFDGIWKIRPESFAEVVSQPIRFHVYSLSER